MTAHEHDHCQCDFCSGVDCGADDPEKRRVEEKQHQDEHDAATRKNERETVLDEFLNRLWSTITIHPDSPEGKVIKTIVKSMRSGEPAPARREGSDERR